jgi:hypothetical protein
MSEQPQFIPPPNLFLLNPQHDGFLSGKNQHFRDYNLLFLYVVPWGGLIVLWLIVAIKMQIPNPPNLLYFAGVVILAYLVIRQVVRNLQLEREGQLIVGEVANSKGKSVKGGYYQVDIEYTFAFPEGYPLTRKESAIRNDLREKPLPVSGTPVMIVYLNPKLFRLL